MAGQLLILQAGVSAALAGSARQVFDWTDQDQLGQRACLLQKSDHPANPDADRFHVGYD
jgi:hypothetical protein